MTFQWDGSLSTNINEIDEQHRQIIEQLDVFLSAISKGTAKEEVEKILAFLEFYALRHFAAEEGHMATHGYPDLAAHRRRHAQFLKELSVLKAQFERDGATGELVMATRLRLLDWFIRHIKREDWEFGLFLKKEHSVR
jgi:hemerythrin